MIILDPGHNNCVIYDLTAKRVVNSKLPMEDVCSLILAKISCEDKNKNIRQSQKLYIQRDGFGIAYIDWFTRRNIQIEIIENFRTI